MRASFSFFEQSRARREGIAARKKEKGRSLISVSYSERIKPRAVGNWTEARSLNNVSLPYFLEEHEHWIDK